MLAANLQNQQPSSVWRSTSAATQDIIYYMPNGGVMRALGIFNHNLTTSAYIETFFSTDAFATIAKQLIFNVTNPYVLGLGLEPLGICTLGSTGLCQPIPGTSLNNFYLFDEPLVYPYTLVRINDPDNPDGFIQAGRIVLGNYWQPTYNPSYGYRQQLQVSDSGRESRSGAWYARQKPQHNEFSMSFPWLDAGEAAQLNTMIRQVGQYKNILFAAYPRGSGPEKMQNLGLCFLKSQSGFSRDEHLFRKFDLTLREAL
jgi:hypothetical protein